MSLLPLFYKGLTPELLKKAEKDLNETPQVRKKELEEFKKRIKEQKDILCSMEDDYLLRFLRVKKFNVDRAMKVLRNHINLLQSYSGVYTNILPSQLKHMVNNNPIFHQPYRLPDFSYIGGLRAGLLGSNESIIDDLVAFIFTVGNTTLEYEATQISGVHIICDLADVTIHQYKRIFNISNLRFGFRVYQDGTPMRIRGIHITRGPYIGQILYNVVKLLGTKKLAEKLHVYGQDLSKLHQKIPKEFLPPWLGGTMDSVDDEEFASIFYSHEDHIKRMKEYKIIEIKT